MRAQALSSINSTSSSLRLCKVLRLRVMVIRILFLLLNPKQRFAKELLLKDQILSIHLKQTYSNEFDRVYLFSSQM